MITTTMMRSTWIRGVVRSTAARAAAVAGSFPKAGAGVYSTEPRDVAPVVKLGGSLLARGGWPAALAALLAEFRCGALLVVGGGTVVDGLRQLDSVTRLPPEVSHLLAIEALGITARAVAAATGLPLTGAADDAELVPGRPSIAILDTPRWLGADGDGAATFGTPLERLAALPCGWHVTSDAIAALVAVTLARPLVLVKSVPPPMDAGDLSALADAGWVDEYFPRAAATLGEIAWAAPAPA